MEHSAEKLEDFAARAGLRFAILFGSQASGTAHEASDYDVALLYHDPKKFSEVYTEALEVVSVHLHVPEEKIDLADLGRENILLRYNATKQARLLYGNPADFAQYRAFAFREHIDAKPLYDLEETLVRKRQQSLNAFITAV